MNNREHNPMFEFGELIVSWDTKTIFEILESNFDNRIEKFVLTIREFGDLASDRIQTNFIISDSVEYYSIPHPKQKANLLANSFVSKSIFDMDDIELTKQREQAKKYALIAMDEIYEEANCYKNTSRIKYWGEVQQHILEL